MKTIDELAWEAYDDDRKLAQKCQTPAQAWIDWFTKGFHKGAESEHAELTRWNDPKEVLPAYHTPVLIKYRQSGLFRMAVAWLSVKDSGGYLWTIDGTSRHIEWDRIISWREIHE